jgi:hypothetical protein
MINIKLIKEGDIILVHKIKFQGISDIPAPVIRKLTKCYYNHSALVTNYLDRLYVSEAVSNGFVPTQTLEEYLNDVDNNIRDIIILRVNNSNKQELYYNLVSIINHKYGYGTLIFTQLIYQLTKKWFGNGWWLGKSGNAAKRTVVCSEVIANGYPKLFTEDPARVTPKDIFVKIYTNLVKVIFESNIEGRKKFELKNNILDY